MTRMFLLTTLAVSHAHAGLLLTIEQPRRNYQNDKYKIKCVTECALEVSGTEKAKKLSLSKDLLSKTKEVIEAEKPQNYKGTDRLTLYKISGSDGSKKFELRLGHPTSYTGEDYLKYSNMVNLLEQLKHMIFLETSQEVKK